MANLPFQFNSDILGEDLAARLEELTSQNNFAAAQSLIAETLNDIRSTPEADVTEQDVQQFHTLVAIGSEIATINIIGLEAYQTVGELAQNGNWTDLQLLAADFLNNEDLSAEQSAVFTNVYEQASYQIELAQFDTANSILASGDTEAMREFATERTEDPTLDATSFDSYGWNQLFLNTGFDPELAYTEDFYNFYETAAMDAELDAMKARMDELVAANDFEGIQEMVASVYETANTSRDGQTAHYAQKFLQYTWEQHLSSVERRETSGELIRETEGESYLFGLIEGQGEYNAERQYLQTDMVRMMSDMERAREFGHHSMDSQELVRRMMAQSILENTSTDLAYNGNPTDISAGELNNNFYWLRESMLMALKGEDEILQQFNTGEITALMNGQIPESLANDEVRRAALSAYGVDELSGVFSDTDPQRYLRSRALLQSASVDVTYEQPPEGSTEEELAENGNWLRSSVTLALAEADDVIDQFTDEEIQSLLRGEIAESLQGDTARLTELSQYGLNVMGQDMYNLLAKAQTAGVLTEDGPVTQAMLAGRDLYETLPNFTGSGSWRMLKGVLSDPTTYVGAGVFFKGVQGANITGRVLLTQGAKVGALEGLVYGVADERLTQSVEIAGGRIEEADLQRLAVAGGIGMLAGATLGRVIDGATVAVPKAYNRLMNRGVDNAVDAGPAPRIDTAQPEAPITPDVPDATDAFIIPRSEIDSAPAAVNLPDAPDAPTIDTTTPRIPDAPTAAPDLRVVTEGPGAPRTPEAGSSTAIPGGARIMPPNRGAFDPRTRFDPASRIAAVPETGHGMGGGTTTPPAQPNVTIEAPARPRGFRALSPEDQAKVIEGDPRFADPEIRNAFLGRLQRDNELNDVLPFLHDGTFARYVSTLPPEVQTQTIANFRAPESRDAVTSLVGQFLEDIDAPRTAPPRLEEPAAPTPPPRAEEPAAEPTPSVETPEGAGYDLSRPSSIKPEHAGEITEEYLETLTAAQLSRMRPSTLRALHADGKLEGLEAEALTAATEKMRAVNAFDEAAGTPPPRRPEGEPTTPRTEDGGDKAETTTGPRDDDPVTSTAHIVHRRGPQTDYPEPELARAAEALHDAEVAKRGVRSAERAYEKAFKEVVDRRVAEYSALTSKPDKVKYLQRLIRQTVDSYDNPDRSVNWSNMLVEKNNMLDVISAVINRAEDEKGAKATLRDAYQDFRAEINLKDATTDDQNSMAMTDGSYDMGKVDTMIPRLNDIFGYNKYGNMATLIDKMNVYAFVDSGHLKRNAIMRQFPDGAERDRALKNLNDAVFTKFKNFINNGASAGEVYYLTRLARYRGFREFLENEFDAEKLADRFPSAEARTMVHEVVIPTIKFSPVNGWAADSALGGNFGLPLSGLYRMQVGRWLKNPTSPETLYNIKDFALRSVGIVPEYAGGTGKFSVSAFVKGWGDRAFGGQLGRIARLDTLRFKLSYGSALAAFAAPGLISYGLNQDDSDYGSFWYWSGMPFRTVTEISTDAIGGLTTVPNAVVAGLSNNFFDTDLSYSYYFTHVRPFLADGIENTQDYLNGIGDPADPTRPDAPAGPAGPAGPARPSGPTTVGALDDGTNPPPASPSDNDDAAPADTITADATDTTTTTPTDTTVATVTDAASNAVRQAGDSARNVFSTASAYSAEEAAEAILPGIGGNLASHASQVQYGRWWSTLMNGLGWAGTAAGGIWNAMPQFLGPTGGAIAQGVTAIMAAMMGKNLVTGLWSRLTSAKGLGSMALTGLFAVGAVHAFNYFSGRDDTRSINFTNSNYGTPETGLGRTTIQDLGPRVTPAGEVVGQVGGIRPSDSEFAAANEILKPLSTPRLTTEANASFVAASLDTDERNAPLLPGEMRINGHMNITGHDGVPAVLASVETLGFDGPTQSWTNMSEIATEGADASTDLGYVAAQNGLNIANVAPIVAATYAAYGLDEDGQRRDAEFLPDALKGNNRQEIRFDMVAQLDSANTIGWSSGTASSGALTPNATPEASGPISFENLIA